MFGGGGSIQAMQSSIKNNRKLLREKRPFKKQMDYLDYAHHKATRKDIKWSQEKKIEFRRKLQAKKNHDQKVMVITIAIASSILVTLLAIITNLSVF